MCLLDADEVEVAPWSLPSWYIDVTDNILKFCARLDADRWRYKPEAWSSRIRVFWDSALDILLSFWPSSRRRVIASLSITNLICPRSQVLNLLNSIHGPRPVTGDRLTLDLDLLLQLLEPTNNENSVPESCVVSLSNDISGPHPCLSCCKSELSMLSSMPVVGTYTTTSHALDLELGAGILILARTGELEGNKFI